MRPGIEGSYPKDNATDQRFNSSDSSINGISNVANCEGEKKTAFDQY